MVSALYDRIDANEQFAADVSHEIKNPLASLRSAVGTCAWRARDDQRNKLLEVIEHDVQRLDRLVSDISNASRLDSELVKEEEEEFDLVRTLENLSQYHGEEAAKKGVDFITDLPPEPIRISGLRRGWRRSSSTCCPTPSLSARKATRSASGPAAATTAC
jgi:two-component system sensor histidine kinase ChvG